jgi:uridine kinase
MWGLAALAYHVTGSLVVIMVTVGIAGPSGSGKSKLCSCLLGKLPGARLLQQDWYFKAPEELPADANFCDPRHLHLDQFIRDALTLSQGHAITVPNMDMSTFTRTGEVVTIEPGRYLLIEGMTIFRIPEIFDICQRRIYISPGIAAIRRRKWRRDKLERGRDAQNIRAQLAWVELEYQNDLECIQSDILLLNGVVPLNRMCRLAENFIR